MNTPLLLRCLAGLAFLPLLVQAENPHWIWHPNNGAPIRPNDVRFFRKSFRVERVPTRAPLTIAADDEAVVYLNGQEVARNQNFKEPTIVDVTDDLQRGDNILVIRAKNNAADQAGVLFMLELRSRNRSEYIVSDTSWQTTDAEAPDWQRGASSSTNWVPAVSRGKLGDSPWGNILKVAEATPASALTALPGFKVELLHSSELGQGSWICMTVDAKGRLIISPQADNQPLLRVTLGRSGRVAKIENIPAPVHQAMGMLYAYKSLYVNGHGPNGTGLYRLIDANGNDRFDTNEVHFLKKFDGEGEHGYHAVVLGPDKMIYVMNGNHTKVPEGMATNSPHRNFQEELLLPRQWDAGGHAVGILAPGGYVLRTDPEGKNWELVLAGFRNAYDFDFSSDGELFAFDSDMEWDWGLPWYRPTRLVHCVPAAEFGWRSGSAVWPTYYPDSLPPAVDIGIGSPTGVKFGTNSKFPERYRKAAYLLDWSYGRIFAVHLRPTGATYAGDYEVLVKGKPLNVTDVEFGKDGAMYFITGGRGTQSGLYRVSYTGPAPRKTATEPEIAVEKAVAKAGAKARTERHQLEDFYGKRDPRAIDAAWPYLGSPDRFLSYAARIVLEGQDVALWNNRALAETNTDAALNVLLALARCGSKSTQAELLLALKKFPMDSLTQSQQLDKLRIIELSFMRQGRPEPELAKLAIEKLDRLYPAADPMLNHELSQLLIYLEAPGVVGKTLKLLDQARTQEEQAHYIFCLRTLTNGWTIAERKHYFDWFRFAQEASKGEVTYPQGSPYLVWSNQKKASQRHPAELLAWFKEAGRDYGDGASYPKYLVNIRKDAIEALSADDRIALGSWIADYAGMAAFKPSKPRSFVQEWKMSDIEPSLDEVSHGRNFASGKAALNDAQCLLCHRFGANGGSVGPELTALSSKYSRRDILESLLEPSKVVSEQFQNFMVIKKDGQAETGRIVDETDDKLVLQASMLAPERVEIKKADVAERRPAALSPMPDGLLNELTRDEILDLIAYLESGGKEDAANFSAPAASR